MTFKEAIKNYGKDLISTKIVDEKLKEIAEKVGNEDVPGVVKAMQNWVSMYRTRADNNPEFYFENIAKSYIFNR